MHEEFVIPFVSVTDDVRLGKNVVMRPFVNLYNCTIGDDTKIGAMTEIGGAVVGKRCKIGAQVFIPPGVLIGDEVFIGPGVKFSNDKYPKAIGEWTQLKTIVESGVSIGLGSIILPGVRIGAGAVIGAGSVVTKDVQAGEMWYGEAARLR